MDGKRDAIHWLYPNATYDSSLAVTNTILAGTNAEGITINFYLFLNFNFTFKIFSG